jgi:hypothetical protein
MQAFEFVLTLSVVLALFLALSVIAILAGNKKSQADIGRVLQMFGEASFMIVTRSDLYFRASNQKHYFKPLSCVRVKVLHQNGTNFDTVRKVCNRLDESFKKG